MCQFTKELYKFKKEHLLDTKESDIIVTGQPSFDRFSINSSRLKIKTKFFKKIMALVSIIN